MILQNSLSLTQSAPTQQPATSALFQPQQVQNTLSTLNQMGSQMDILRALGLQQDFSSILRRTDPQPIRNDFNLGVDFTADKTRQLAAASAINPFLSTSIIDPYAIEKQAKLYRNAACKLYFLKCI